MTNKQKELYAEMELEILKNQTDVKFILDEDKLDLKSTYKCLYGQVFKYSYSDEAMRFKQKHNIEIYYTNVTHLEKILCELWSKGKKQECIKILDEFVEWKEPKKNLNDFRELIKGWDE